MSFLAFVLIALSAMLHATWNLLAKKDHMSIAFYALLCSVGPIVWFHVLFWTPVTLSALSPYFWLCVAGMLASEVVYGFGLSLTYRKLEMVTAYPLVRALPILLTAVVTSLLSLGDPLTLQAGIGFVIVFCGALLMPLAKFSDFSFRQYWNPALLLILFTACGTTGYTIFDSQAQKWVRAAGEGVAAPLISMTYYAIRGLCLASTLWILTLISASGRAAIRQFWKERNWHPIAAGVCGSLTYLLVLIAMNFVSNVSYVQVFRQLGLPIGMCAGVLILHEKNSAAKWTGLALILLGLAISTLHF